MLLFYTPDIQPHHKAFVLSEEESKHAIRVLRLAVGGQIHLVDGRGGLYTATIVDAHPKRTVLEIIAVHLDFERRPYHLHIAIAPTKNIDRVEWFLEKATEIGIDEITPIICERSERKEVKIERLNKVMVAAMKQSLKAYLPKLNEAISYNSFLNQELGGHKLIAHCGDGDKTYINQTILPTNHCLVLIGPEGDFSTSEIGKAESKGFQSITLGDARLRTETAALASCIEVALLNRR